MRDVRLRYFDGCPNWHVAQERLKVALRQAGVESEILLERVETAEDAEVMSFRGSPSILIDGIDPFADPDAPTGLSCRVFRTENGIEGSPAIIQLVDVLRGSA